jgi:hypothetical protein
MQDGESRSRAHINQFVIAAKAAGGKAKDSQHVCRKVHGNMEVTSLATQQLGGFNFWCRWPPLSWHCRWSSCRAQQIHCNGPFSWLQKNISFDAQWLLLLHKHKGQFVHPWQVYNDYFCRGGWRMVSCCLWLDNRGTQ